MAIGCGCKGFPRKRQCYSYTVEFKTAKGNITRSIQRLHNLELMNPVDGQDVIDSDQPGKDPEESCSNSGTSDRCSDPTGGSSRTDVK